jgi:hypothetical protein
MISNEAAKKMFDGGIDLYLELICKDKRMKFFILFFY